jgi:hypothetical protein
MVAESVPENFDWVKARKLCSLGTAFEILRLFVKGDIDTRNSMRKSYIPDVNAFMYKFDITGNDRNFTVILTGQKLHKSVTFTLTEACIEVQSESATMFKTTVGLNDEGECAFFVGGQERKSWQIRKMALDQLFFDIDY